MESRGTRRYVGDSIVRKTDSTLNKDEDIVDCLPGARIEHVTERVQWIMGIGNGGTLLVHIGTNNAAKEGTTAIVEKYRDLLKKTKQARVGQIILSGIFTNVWKQDTRIQKFEADGSQRDGATALQGRGSGIREFVGQLCVGKEEMYVRDGLHLSGKGAAVFAEGLSGAVASGLGKVRYLN